MGGRRGGGAVRSSLASAAQAQDFFSQLFGGFGRSRAPVDPDAVCNEGGLFARRARRAALWRRRSGVLRAHLRRPPFPDHRLGQCRAARQSCSNLCPASETKVVYGGSIDDAATDNGKPYSELPNAFRYRNEIVSGCTCNGKDPLGLAQVKIEDDPTLRKGDIVAGENGLVVASRGADKRGAELNFSPASDRIRARYRARAGGGAGVTQRCVSRASHGHPRLWLTQAVAGLTGMELSSSARSEPLHRRARSSAGDEPNGLRNA